MVLPTEPNDDNAAVVAAYFGHKDIVKELLDSLRGKPWADPASPQVFQELCATALRGIWGFLHSLEGVGLNHGKVRGEIRFLWCLKKTSPWGRETQS